MITGNQPQYHAGGIAACSPSPQEQIAQALGAIQACDISGFILTIETRADWVAYKDPNYELSSPSMKENRFNREGQSAIYIASGDSTAQANVLDWATKVKFQVEPQQLNCFDLGAFADAHGMAEQYRVTRASGGYPLPQATADLLLEKYHVTGILYRSAGDDGYCVVIRPPNNGKVGDHFFTTGKA